MKRAAAVALVAIVVAVHWHHLAAKNGPPAPSEPVPTLCASTIQHGKPLPYVAYLPDC